MKQKNKETRALGQVGQPPDARVATGIVGITLGGVNRTKMERASEWDCLAVGTISIHHYLWGAYHFMISGNKACAVTAQWGSPGQQVRHNPFHSHPCRIHLEVLIWYEETNII